MFFHSTRGKDKDKTFEQVLMQGLADDGGLFIPDNWPKVDINKLKEELMSNSLITNCSDANLPYFGIPLSVYNFLFSITFLILIIFNAYKKEK